MRYPGGKGKTFQHIINLLPVHSTYIESHLGGGAVLRNKTPVRRSIGIDRDPQVIEMWRTRYPGLAQFVTADAIDFLSRFQFSGEEVVYCDPPYLPSVRRRERIYRFEYTVEDHRRLLEILRRLPCRVLLSGYESDLYREALADWKTVTFSSKAHDGVRREVLWFNFAPPERLHDFRYWGGSFRQREAVKRRLQRLKSRIEQLSIQEQHHVADWLGSFLQRR